MALPLVRRRVGANVVPPTAFDDDETRVDASVSFEDALDALDVDFSDDSAPERVEANLEESFELEVLEAEVEISVDVEELAADNDASGSASGVDEALDMTVMPLGSYDLLYLSSAPNSCSVAECASSSPDARSPVDDAERDGFLLDSERGIVFAETVRPERRTFYRETKPNPYVERSDVDALAANLVDDECCGADVLCRGLRALAGLSLTPAASRVEPLAPAPESSSDAACGELARVG
jgi:hypothetical protein